MHDCSLLCPQGVTVSLINVNQCGAAVHLERPDALVRPFGLMAQGLGIPFGHDVAK